MSETSQPSPIPKAFKAVHMVVGIATVCAAILYFVGYSWVGRNVPLFVAPLFMLTGLQWWLWPSTSSAAEPRTAKILGAALFLLMALVWLLAFIELVTE